MSRNLRDLETVFGDQIEGILYDLLKEGFHLRPFYTQRTVWEQAKLWRQSRTFVEIGNAAEMLARENAPWLAEVLMGVGPQQGLWATNALPGQSWHQWGQAVDCFVVDEQGRAIWYRDHPGYQRYAAIAKEKGLNAGAYWRRRDVVHVQKQFKSIRTLFTWADIHKEMKERFKEIVHV